MKKNASSCTPKSGNSLQQLRQLEQYTDSLAGLHVLGNFLGVKFS